MDLTALACPRCHRALVARGDAALACAACPGAYPVLAGAPILVPEPAPYLRHSALALAESRREIARTLDELAHVPDEPTLAFRRALTARASDAAKEDLQLLDRVLSPLLEHTGRGSRAAGAVHRFGERVLGRLARAARRRATSAAWATPKTGYAFEPALGYLRTDWGRTEDGEAQIATLNQAVEESVRQHMGTSPGHAVYLGAGLGRHAFDGAALFASVLAVELSFAAAALLSAVREGPVRFSTPNWHGATNEDDLIQAHKAVFPPPPYGQGCTYVVGDALTLPLADASVDAVVSIFFADVTPASKLLPEVKRVLRPGGRFINVGPLEYHFKGRAERFTRDELRHVFEEVHGLRFEPGERSFELPYMVAPGTVRTLFRVWSYVATRV